MENENITYENPAQTMRKAMEEIGGYEEITAAASPLIEATVITTPDHRNIHDVTKMFREAGEYLKPARRKGHAKLADLASLIAWANRFKGSTSALFANPDMSAPSLTCITDYHAPGEPDPLSEIGDPTARHCHHRGSYHFPLSEEWNSWMKISGLPLDKDEMGQFIEDHAIEVMDPTTAMINLKISDKNTDWENRLIEIAHKIEGKFGQLSQLLAMSRQFQIFETSDLKVATNRDTGEAEIQFLNEHKDAQGQKLNIPNIITIAIPVFQNGAPYRMAVRFRYRKSGSTVKFIMTIHRPEKIFEAAFKEAIEQAHNETDLPTFYGTPES